MLEKLEAEARAFDCGVIGFHKPSGSSWGYVFDSVWMV